MTNRPEIQMIAITRADGGVAVMQFVTKSRGVERDDTDKSISAEIAKAGLECVSWRRIDPSELPYDRAFRNAWMDTGKAVAVNMAEARDIHRGRMRSARAPLLATLDVEYQRMDEAGDTRGKAGVVARKQALRDVTADPAIEAAQTPDELQAVWPAALLD